MEQNKPFYSLALWVEKDPGEICGLTQEKPSTSGRSRATRTDGQQSSVVSA